MNRINMLDEKVGEFCLLYVILLLIDLILRYKFYWKVIGNWIVV